MKYEMITEIAFYNADHSRCAIQNVSDRTADEIEKIVEVQEDLGMIDHHLLINYKIYCSKCGVRIGVSPIKRPNALCDACMLLDSTNIAIAEKIVDEYKPY